MRLILIMALLIPLGAASDQGKSLPTEKELAQAPVVRIDELTAQPGRYDGVLVRVNALWISGYHDASICTVDGDKHCIGVTLGCSDDELCKEMRQVLDTKLEQNPTGDFWDRRGRLALIGRFKERKKPERNSPRFVLEVLKIEPAEDAEVKPCL